MTIRVCLMGVLNQISRDWISREELLAPKAPRILPRSSKVWLPLGRMVGQGSGVWGLILSDLTLQCSRPPSPFSLCFHQNLHPLPLTPQCLGEQLVGFTCILYAFLRISILYTPGPDPWPGSGPDSLAFLHDVQRHFLCWWYTSEHSCLRKTTFPGGGVWVREPKKN